MTGQPRTDRVHALCWRLGFRGLAFVILLAAGGPEAIAAIHGAAEPAAGRTTVVDMNDLGQFLPAEITVTAGDTVEWRNLGLVRHTITDDPGRTSFAKTTSLPDKAEPIRSGWVNYQESFRYTFTVPGEYRYVCLPHERSKMIGSVTVRAKSAP